MTRTRYADSDRAAAAPPHRRARTGADGKAPDSEARDPEAGEPHARNPEAAGREATDREPGVSASAGPAGGESGGTGLDHRQEPRTAPSTADLLETFPRLFDEQRIPLRRLLEALGDRGMASALLVLSAPQLLPLPLGVSNALALPILLVTLQMAAGSRQPWLPEWVLDRPVTRDKVLGACRRTAPLMRRIERVIRTRWRHIWQPPADRLVGLCCVVISLVSLAPLPLTGWLPGAALLIVALGLLERDGMIVATGLALGAAAIGVFVAVVAGLVEAGEKIQQMAQLASEAVPAAPALALASGLAF